MGDWHSTTLGEVLAAGGGWIQTGPFGSQLHASDYVDVGIPCIMPVNMKENRVDVTGIARISERDAERLSRHLVEEGDIVYSRRGDVTQKALIGRAEVGYFCGTGCLLVRPGHAIDPEFLTYYMSTPAIKEWLVSQSVGATMPNLNTGILAKVPLRIPDKSIQKRIASVLSALDAKIALNTRINAELEALAKLVYDYWFVQFDFPISAAQAKRMGNPALAGKPYKSSGGAMVYNKELKREVPEGWEVGNLMEEMDVQYGFPFDTNQFIEDVSEKPVVRIRDILNCTFSAYSSQEVNEKYALQTGDLLIGMDGNFHMNYWDRDAGYLNQRSVRIRSPKGSSVSTVQCFYDIQPHIKAREASVSRTTVGHLSDKDLKRMHVLVPAESKSFQPKVMFDGLLTLMLSNRIQNQELAALRDWLLPLLMNGQVVVGSEDQKIGQSDDQKIGRSEDGNAGMAVAAEPVGKYGKKKD